MNQLSMRNCSRTTLVVRILLLLLIGGALAGFTYVQLAANSGPYWEKFLVPGPFPTPGIMLEDPATDTSAFPVAAPIPFDTVIARGDSQVNTWIKRDRDESGFVFATADEIAQIPSHAIISSLPVTIETGTITSYLMGPSLAAYENVGTYRRDWVEMGMLPSGVRFEGVLWLGGSFHLQDEPYHDTLVSVLLDYKQIPFSLGGKIARSHVVRIPRDRVLIYEFGLPEAMPDGQHVLTIVTNWDPWRIYTTRAVRNAFVSPGKISWSSAGPLRFYQLNVSNKYFQVGDSRNPPVIPVQRGVRSQPIQDGLLGPLTISRGRSAADPIWRFDQALAADEPNRLYAYVTYAPNPELTEVQHGRAVLTMFIDDQQVPINGQPAFFWDIEAGTQYQIPLDIPFPADKRVHALYTAISLNPFLKPEMFDMQELPRWTEQDGLGGWFVPLVPSRDWIPWLPEIGRE